METETQEMYLIVIDKLMKENGNVRLVDIASERGFTKSTVHAGLKLLEESNLITITNNHVKLTKEGQEKVDNLNCKHALIVDSLVLLGLSNEIAEKNACAIEHALSDEVYEVLQKHVDVGKAIIQARETKLRN